MNAPVVIEFSFNGKKYPNLQGGMEAVANTLDLSKNVVKAGLKEELQKFLNEVAQALATKHGTGYPGGTTQNSLSRRSGGAMQSILRSVKVTGTSLNTTQGSIGGDFYLKIHEFGGTIRPKNSQYLAIPLNAAMNANGTLKRPRPRDWDHTFVAASYKNGERKLIIYRRIGRKITPLYLLVGPGENPDRIEFGPNFSGRGRGPTRLGMGAEINKRMDRFTDRLANRILQELLNDSNVPA
jgi:hypothetical protein